MARTGHAFASWFFATRAGTYAELGNSIWLLMAIADYADWGTGQFDYSQTRVAKELAMSRRNLCRLHDQLVDLGWLADCRRGQYGVRGRIARWGQFLAWRGVGVAAAQVRVGSANLAQPTSEPRPAFAPTWHNSAGGCDTSCDTSCDTGCDNLAHYPGNQENHEKVTIELLHTGTPEPPTFGLWRRHFGREVDDDVRERLIKLAEHYQPEALERAFAVAEHHQARYLTYVEKVLERWRRARTPVPTAPIQDKRSGGNGNGKDRRDYRPPGDAPVPNDPLPPGIRHISQLLALREHGR